MTAIRAIGLVFVRFTHFSYSSDASYLTSEEDFLSDVTLSKRVGEYSFLYTIFTTVSWICLMKVTVSTLSECIYTTSFCVTVTVSVK